MVILLQRSLWAIVSVALLMVLLTGCQLQLLTPVPSADAPAETSTPEPEATAIEVPTVEPTEIPTEAPTNTPAPTATPTVAPTETATTVPTEVPTEAPTATTEPTAEPEAFTASIAVPSLNIRGGPGTNYPIVGSAPQGTEFVVIGQVAECQWYLIDHPDLGDAWVAGSAQFVTSSGDCSEVIEVANPPAPPAVPPTATAAPSTAEPPAEDDSGATVPDDLPADQGCYLFQNQLGPELTITFTRSDGNWSDTIKVRSDKDEPYCFAPGKYTVTVDAPPPWGELNSELKVNAGDRFYYPIRPRE